MKKIFSNRRIAPLAALSLVASLGTLLSAPLVHAASSYVGTWNGIYPGSGSADNADCQLCHAASTQNLNPYGEAICSSNAGNISNRIQAVEAINSDTDPTGSDNLTEIIASTQPGWTPGNVNPTYNRGNCNATGNVEAPPTSIAGDMDPVAGNQPPVADANGPYSGTVNVPLTLDGSASSDPDGTIVDYSWNFGDGNTGTGASPTHTYITDGTFTVSLTVTDDAGDTGTDATTATIGLGNQPPVADANGPYSGTVGVAVSFDGTGSNDPDGTIASYSWDFGDGSTGNGPSPTHTYATVGMFNVTLTVTDDTGASDSAGTSADIAEQPVNQPPVADANGPYSGTAGVAITFDGSGSTDPDGSIVDYSWDFGDGSTGSGPTPSHTYAAEGTYHVTLQVSDDAGATDSAMTTATIAPVAGGADVFLTSLNAPNNVTGKTGRTKSREIKVKGDGVTIAQDATVSLSVVSPAGVTVVAHPASMTKLVSPDNGATKYRFDADISCDAPGTYVLEWTATISAAQNSDPGNDTLTDTTSVRCKMSKDDDDDDADEKEDDDN